MNAKEPNIHHIHQSFIDTLKEKGYIKSAKVEEAFRAIPRHLFVPNVSPEEAYSERAISTKRLEGMGSVSSSSAPGLMAEMLEHLDLHEGQKVLEIGAATGYNASLIAHIAGSKGKVVTIDIDQDLVDSAIENIKKVGVTNVDVLCKDGALGDKANSPYDRIIVTVGVPTITPEWFNQLKDNGILILPLELSELETLHENQPVIVFKKNGNHLESIHIQRSGFMRLRGEHSKKTSGLYDLGNDLLFITPSNIDNKAIKELLRQEARRTETEMQVTYRELFGIHRWLSLRCSNYCNLYMGQNSQKLSHFFTRDGNLYSTVGLCNQSAISILDVDPEIKNNYDSGKIIIKTYGNSEILYNEVLEQLKQWNEAGRPFVYDDSWTVQGISIKAFPTSSNIKPPISSTMLDKASVKLVISWINN